MGTFRGGVGRLKRVDIERLEARVLVEDESYLVARVGRVGAGSQRDFAIDVELDHRRVEHETSTRYRAASVLDATTWLAIIGGRACARPIDPHAVVIDTEEGDFVTRFVTENLKVERTIRRELDVEVSAASEDRWLLPLR